MLLSSFQKRSATAVSVIVPAYNVAAFVSQALDSVFGQSYLAFEVIVINDGSPDTEDLERVLAPYQPQIVYIRQENRGLAGALNSAIQVARGTHLAFLDGDDCWPPEYLEVQMRLFEDTPCLDLVYADAALFGYVPIKRSGFISASHPPLTLKALLVEGNQIIPSGTVVRRQTIIDAGCFDESLRICQDYDMWLRIAHRGARIAHQSKLPALRRLHDGALTTDYWKTLRELIHVLTKVDDTFQLPAQTSCLLQLRLSEAQAVFSLNEGKERLSLGDFASAATLLARANSVHNRAKLNIAIFGLRLAPRLTRLMALAWEKLLRSWNFAQLTFWGGSSEAARISVTAEQAQVRWEQFRQPNPITLLVGKGLRTMGRSRGAVRRI